MKDIHDQEYIAQRSKELGYKPKRQAILSRAIIERVKQETQKNLGDFIDNENLDVPLECIERMCDIMCRTLCKETRFDPDVTYYTPNTMANMQKYNQRLAAEFGVSVYVAQRGRTYCEKYVKEREMTEFSNQTARKIN